MYKSTRGIVSNLSFEDTLFNGWLEDGGLAVPCSIPFVDDETKQKWKHLSFAGLTQEIVRLFVPKDFIDDSDLKDLIENAYNEFSDDITPLHSVNSNTYVLELFHGPTMAFKDISMALVLPLMNHALRKRSKHALIYVCTSGDTGSAAIHVSKKQSEMDTLVLYPGHNRISEMQEKLMTTVDAENIHLFAGDSFCDVFDDVLLELSVLVRKEHPDHVCTSLNSILWCRIIGQITHQIYSYLKVAPNVKSNATFVIPTGGGGHMTASIIAQKLGFPIRLVVASNMSNPNLYNLLSGGVMTSHAAVQQTFSPAMDIQMMCNLERWIYLVSSGDTEAVMKCAKELNDEHGSFKLSPELYEQIRSHLEPYCCSDDDVIKTMKNCWTDFRYIIDPHTAVGFNRFYERGSSEDPVVYFATASPIKYPDVLEKAGIPIPKEFTQFYSEMRSKPTFSKHLPEEQSKWVEYLRNYVNDLLA